MTNRNDWLLREDIFILVIDNGSASIKAGFAGEDSPRAFFPSVLSVPRRQEEWQNRRVGEEAIHQTKYGNGIKSAIQRGHVDMDDLELLWRHVFYGELGVSPEEHPVLLTEPILNSKEQRQKMLELYFEKYDPIGVYVANPASLAMYASGRNTGIVLSSGEGVTYASPVYEGHTLLHATQKLELAGQDITDFLARLIDDQLIFTSTKTNNYSQRLLVQDIKEKKGCLAEDYKREMDSCTMNSIYELPDGMLIDVGKERYTCTEALFQPFLAGVEGCGIHELIYDAINKCDAEIQPQLFKNIVLEGGSTLFPNLDYRLQKELKNLVPNDTKISVISPVERKFSTWIGGSILASMSSFRPLFISQSEYEEYGSSIVHRKCF